jgi:hypothetical protein
MALKIHSAADEAAISTTEVIDSETTTEVDIPLVVARFQQECERCLRTGDMFLNIVANSEEVIEAILALRDKLSVEIGTERIAGLFPKTSEKILLVVEQSQPLTWFTMGMAEYESVHEHNLQLMGFFGIQLGPRLGLPQITMTDQDGNHVNACPVLYDYAMFKQALMNFAMQCYGNMMLNKYDQEQQKQPKIKTSSEILEEALRNKV